MGALQSAVDGDRRRLERLGGLARRVSEYVTQDQHGALPGRQVLQCRGEGELDALALFVAGVRSEQAALEAEPFVRVGLQPDRFGHRFGGAVVGVGRGRVVDRQHPLRPPLDRLQAGVGGDLVEPGAKRASPLESCQPALEGLLEPGLLLPDRRGHRALFLFEIGVLIVARHLRDHALAPALPPAPCLPHRPRWWRLLPVDW